MADIGQIRSEVNSACARYADDKAKMERAVNDMQMYQEQANQAQREMRSVQDEMISVEREISSLQSEINSSSDDESGSVNAYAIQRLNLLAQKQQALGMKMNQLRGTYEQAQANYSNAHNQYAQAENDLNTVKNYLEQMRSQMMQAAAVFQKKIDGFNTSLQILGSASGNMFASSANSQIGHLQLSRNQYQENLDIANSIIEQINTTIGGGQGGGGNASASSFSRGGRRMGGYDPGHEREMTTEPNRGPEFPTSSPSNYDSGWDSLSEVPFAGKGRSR